MWHAGCPCRRARCLAHISTTSHRPSSKWCCWAMPALARARSYRPLSRARIPSSRRSRPIVREGHGLAGVSRCVLTRVGCSLLGGSLGRRASVRTDDRRHARRAGARRAALSVVPGHRLLRAMLLDRRPELARARTQQVASRASAARFWHARRAGGPTARPSLRAPRKPQ